MGRERSALRLSLHPIPGFPALLSRPLTHGAHVTPADGSSSDSKVENELQNCPSPKHFLNLLRLFFPAVSLAQINSKASQAPGSRPAGSRPQAGVRPHLTETVCGLRATHPEPLLPAAPGSPPGAPGFPGLSRPSAACPVPWGPKELGSQPGQRTELWPPHSCQQRGQALGAGSAGSPAHPGRFWPPGSAASWGCCTART